MKKRTWTQEEKLKIIAEAKSNGVSETLEKYGIYPATYYSWKKKLLIDGEEGLIPSQARDEKRRLYKNRIAELEDQVSLYKQLLAEKELELALRDELLKKKYPRLKERR